MICVKENGKLEHAYNEDNFLKEYEGHSLPSERVMNEQEFNVSDLLQFKNLDI